MINSTRNEDTIAAIATAPGEGAIGIVRISGPRAIEITSKIFVSSRQKDITTSQNRVFHGEIRDEEGTIDEVLVHIMRAPHSYTREDVVEINCHGGMLPLRKTLELVLKSGARLARPGEFTLRAFLNGRIDLIQAEAVIDRIRAQTDAALKTAAAAAHGVLSQKILKIRDQLADALAKVEAAVDFPEDDLPELVNENLKQQIQLCLNDIQELLKTAQTGRIVREGACIPIVGRPNVGKSSLFNALIQEARAIVTPHPGTTRDFIEETVSLFGIPVRFIDTAGLRDTADEIEQIGVQTARKLLQQADLILLVLDATEMDAPDDQKIFAEFDHLTSSILCVVNKIDLIEQRLCPKWVQTKGIRIVHVSAKTGEGIREIENTIYNMLVGETQFSEHRAIVTHAHQQESLRRAEACLTNLLNNFSLSPEFLSIDLRDALRALGEITGETVTEEILDRIFSQFCIGK